MSNGIASPLTLLMEADRADEVLALSYTFNAGFWEKAALGLARSLQARVTVVSDASQASIDPRATNKAGVTYLDGRAHCLSGGAFHPKLFVIASKHTATVAIGSGNATLSGWQSNAEIWTVLRGNQTAAPSAFRELATWLTSLNEQIAFSDGVNTALNRVASLLATYPTTLDGPRLATTLNSPIIDDLPHGPVDNLLITSPFLDTKAEAIERLVERFQPDAAHIALDDHAEYNGDTLVRVADRHNIHLAEIDSRRYHHGKLVEWTLEGASHGLTGSPNASRPALLLAMHQGGNCELGLVDRHPESIWPQTVPISDPERIREKRFTITPTSPDETVLLGATMVPTGIRLTLAAPLTKAGTQLLVASEDIWLESLPIPEGVAAIDIELRLAAGTHLRLRSPNGHLTNIVAVTDTNRVLHKSLPSTGTANTDEKNAFADPRVAEALARDLADLRRLLDSAPRESDPSDRTATPSQQRFETVDEYLDKLGAKLGDPLVYFGLALPHLGAIGTTPEWSEHEPDPDDPDDPQSSEDKATDEPQLPDLKNRSTKDRIRFRKWATRLVEQMPTLLPAAQLVAARLLLHSIAGGLWDTHEEPFRLLMATVKSLSAADAMFPEERPRLASMCALCLSITRRDISLVSTGPNDVQYTAAVKAARPLLPYADAAVIAAYADDVAPVLGYRASAGQVTQVAHALADPTDEAVFDANELGYNVRRKSRIIELTTGVPHVGDAAMRILGRASDCSPVAVLWNGPDLVYWSVWDDPYLAIEATSTEGVRGELLKLRGLGAPTPKDLVHATRSDLNHFVAERWTERQLRPAAVVDLLATVGITHRPQS